LTAIHSNSNAFQSKIGGIPKQNWRQSKAISTMNAIQSKIGGNPKQNWRQSKAISTMNAIQSNFYSECDPKQFLL
jgi:hypothetical protein